MNILMISSNYPPLVGGPASSVPYLAKHLSQNGFEVHVLTQGCTGYPDLEKNKFYIHRCRIVQGKHYLPHIVIQKAVWMGVLGQKLIEKYKIDLIHSHDLNISALTGLIANLKARKPSICKFGGDLAWEYLSLSKGKEKDPETFLKIDGMKVRFFERVQKKFGDGYKLIAPNSKYQKQWLTKYIGVDPEKIVVLPNGVEKTNVRKKDLINFKKTFGEGTIITTACRIVPWKGINYLIEAVKLLPNRIKLMIAGHGPYERELKKLTYSLKLEKRIKFFGKVPYPKIQAFIKASDVFVLPSMYEPSALALLDALVTKTPIVATDVGGTPEIVKDNKVGLLVRPKDPEDIAKKVNKILEDRKLRERIKWNQEKTIRRYLWKNLVKKYIEVYQKLV